MTYPLLALWSVSGLAMGSLALNIPDSYAGPIVILFLSGLVTFAAWLVKTGQTALSQAKDAAIANAAAVRALSDLTGRVRDLEEWRLRIAENRRSTGQTENERRPE